jgi:hypothetical protein
MEKTAPARVAAGADASASPAQQPSEQQNAAASGGGVAAMTVFLKSKEGQQLQKQVMRGRVWGTQEATLTSRVPIGICASRSVTTTLAPASRGLTRGRRAIACPQEIAMRRTTCTLLVTSLLVFGLLVAGCGSSSTSSSVTGSAASSTSTSPNVGRLPTVKFALHAGLAFGAFHRWIYKPLKNGTFSGGLFKHKVALVKAGLAGLFAYHELKIALRDAQASHKLAPLVAPVTALGDKLKSIGDSAKGGHFDESTINSANGDVTSLSGLAKQAGISITPQEPSTSALAAGG